jgi:hypothetical protein
VWSVQVKTKSLIVRCRYCSGSSVLYTYRRFALQGLEATNSRLYSIQTKRADKPFVLYTLLNEECTCLTLKLSEDANISGHLTMFGYSGSSMLVTVCISNRNKRSATSLHCNLPSAMSRNVCNVRERIKGRAVCGDGN